MAFTDHKITAFTHKISDLADQPNLPPDELKARFDACPEELRVAHNALCDEANRLDERVGGIVAGTFGDTITEDMLSDELRETIEGAAAGGAVTEQIEAETAAREAADADLQDQIDSISTKSCQLYVGSYWGTGAESKSVTLGWKPKVVLIMQYSFRISSADGTVTGGMLYDSNPLVSGSNVGAELTASGFRVYNRANLELNTNDMVYYYIAMR